jgi:hypothetical protein
MPTLKQKLRQVERAAQRLTGDRRQAVGLRKKIERHLHQLAAGQARATGRRVVAVDEAQLLKNLVQFRRAGWVNMPGKGTRVLVERGTGCVLADSKGALILRPREKLPTKPAINRNTFVQHLKTPGIELFVPYMYLYPRPKRLTHKNASPTRGWCDSIFCDGYIAEDRRCQRR